MSLEVQATYEGGLLKPDKPLPFSDHQRVTVTVKPIPALARLWESLLSRPKLRTELDVHRGIEWKRFNESECVSDAPRAGFRPGFSWSVRKPTVRRSSWRTRGSRFPLLPP